MTGLARQTPPGARPNREHPAARSAGGRVDPVRYRLPGRSLETPSNRRPREMVILPKAMCPRRTEPGLQARSESLFILRARTRRSALPAIA